MLRQLPLSFRLSCAVLAAMNSFHNKAKYLQSLLLTLSKLLILQLAELSGFNTAHDAQHATLV